MKRIYRVEFEEKWTGCKDWMPDAKNVLANGDATQAIAKVRKNSLGASYVAEDTGTLQKCVGFRFTAVKVIAEAEI